MDVVLDSLPAEELVWLRSLEDKDGFDTMTCRPIRPRSREEKLKLYQSALDEPNTVILGLWTSDKEYLIGKLTASDWNPRNHSMEIGYYLCPEWRGKGYMRSALQTFCRVLFLDQGCNKIMAQTGAFNVSSIRLLESCGFRRDGVLRQHHEKDGILYDDFLYSLLADKCIKPLESRE